MIYVNHGELHAVDVGGGACVVKAVPPEFVDRLQIGLMLLENRQDTVVVFLSVFGVKVFTGHTH